MIGDRAAVVAAVVACTVAAVASRASAGAPMGTPVVVVVAVAVLGGGAAVWCRRGPVLAGVGAVVVVAGAVGWRAEIDADGLRRPRPAGIDGPAELGSDPVVGRYGTRVEVVARGRRWLASVPRDLEWTLDGLRLGDRVVLSGSTTALVGTSSGWARSRHLAGGLRVRDLRAEGGAPPWYAVPNALLDRLDRGADSFGEERRTLYLGLVVGDDRGQSELTRHRFRVSGLAHLLAVSGQNVAFLLAVVSPLSSRLPLRWRTVLCVVVLAGFVVLTRAEPSVLRATVMAGLASWAAATGRRAPGLRLVALAVVVLLLADPLLVLAVGFQLSVAATVGLVLLARPLQRRLPGPAWLTSPVSVTVAAQAGAMPLVAVHFGATSVLAVPANLAAEPAAGLVMMGGLTVGLACGFLRDGVAAVVQTPMRLLLWWIDGVARTASQVSARPLGPLGWGVLGGVVVLGATVLHRRREWTTVASFSPAVVALALLARPCGPLAQREGIAAGVDLVDRCGVRLLVVARAPPGAGEALAALSARGVARVDAVAADESEPVVLELSDQLRAPIVARATSVAPCRLSG